MRVAIVSPYDWSHPGGVRTHIAGLRSALEKKGMEVSVLAPASAPEPQIVAAGRPVPVPANGSVARLCLSPSAARIVKDHVAAFRPDVIHIHEPAAPSVSLLALLTAGGPRVGTFHASSQRSLAYAAARPVLSRWLSRLSRRVAVSEAARALVHRYFPAPYDVISNGIDRSRFAGAGADPALEALKPFVLFVGRPERRKGFEVAVRAVEILRRRRPDVRLVAAGIGGDPGPSWVVPLGVVEQDRLPGVYAAADVFCAPNLGGESFGLVLAEAMAAGTPVVCSSIPGFVETAGDAAVLVPPGAPGALAEALGSVLGDAARARDLSRRGARRSEAFDWETLAERVVGVYEQAADPPIRGEGGL